MITSIDLFAGCGGLTDGFEKAGYKSLAFVEWEYQPCQTLIKRLRNKWHYPDAENRVMRFDIQRTEELINGWSDDPKYGSHIGLRKLVDNRPVDAIIGGPPCQAYSIAGRVRDENGMHDDYRNFLFESYLEVVSFFQPKVFVFENVEGILSASPGGTPIINRIRQSFSDAGYEIVCDIRNNALLNAADYGVPQKRKRVIIIGVNRDRLHGDPQAALADFYTSILPSFRVNSQVTVKDALNGLPELLPLNDTLPQKPGRISHSYNGMKVLNHVPRFHSVRDQEIFREIAEDKLEGSLKYPSSAELIKLYFEKTGKQSNFHKYHVLDLDKPSNTIPAHLYKDGLRHIHPDPLQARSITPREAARLQGFDDDFEFLGSMGDQYKMIGNAVPPILAEKIARALTIFLEKYF